jgi:hypothetical protein
MNDRLILETRFVEAIMLFGMGMTLTPEEDAELGRIIRPCFAALALTNDYFSFDREMEDAENSTLINSVSIVMRLQDLDISSAKTVIKETIQKYEREFMRQIDEYKQQRESVPEKIQQYMEAMSYQVSGNLVWSLNCPRYNPDYRYRLEACQQKA